MGRHYINTAIRSLLAGRFYSVLNVAGLAIAMASCILIFVYVRNELSYDVFYQDADRIYRVAVERQYPNETVVSARTPRSLAETMASDWPEVQQATRLSREHADRVLVAHGEMRFYETGVLFGDPNFFEVFSLPFIAGDSRSALQMPFSIVVTESAAHKYFGSADPIGETLTLRLLGDGDLFDYTVTAVIRDVPENSHFTFDFLATYQGHPFTTTDGTERTNFESLDVYSYLKLRSGIDATALERRFPDMVRNYLGPQLEAIRGQGFDQYLSAGNAYRYFLQPLRDIHLRSGLADEIEPAGSMIYVSLFVGIACAILALACINFSNLVTARSSTRSREVGLRKSLGSQRAQLVFQFLCESVLVSLIALIPTLGLIELLMPVLGRIDGTAPTFSYTADWYLIPMLIGFALLVGMLAGLYPAIHLSAMRPAVANSVKSGAPLWSQLRSGLVVFQFAVSLVLMVATVVIIYQMRYVNNKQLGFDSGQLLVIEGAEVLRRRPEAFTQALLNVEGVVALTHAENMPGRPFEGALARLEGSTEGAQLGRMFVGLDYVKTLGMNVIEGRDFSRDVPGDAMAVLLNERAVDALGLDDPIGQRVVWTNRIYTVIGVVQDFHFASLHESIGPLMLTGLDPEFENRPFQFFAVRVKTADMARTIGEISRIWTEFAPQQPFSYTSLDADLGVLYQPERRSASLLGTFTSVAFLIACLGLYGLASFNVERRRKEIGVRKVMGGSVWSIVLLLTSDFSKLVLIANLIAWPVAYVAMERWLENFAYRIDLTPLVFIGSGLIALCIAWVTVGGTAAKAANQKPVLALRYE